MTHLSQKQRDILRTAFAVWGDSNFACTSLADVAGRLEITKAALYRHFENKDALLAEMRGQFSDDYCATAECILQRTQRTTGSLIDAFLRIGMRFLLQEPAYVSYFAEYFLPQVLVWNAELKPSFPERLGSIFAQQGKLIDDAIVREYDIKDAALHTEVQRFVFVATAYWSALYVRTPHMRPRTETEYAGEDTFEQYLCLARELIIHGTCAGAPLQRHRLAAVEQIAWRNPGTRLHDDRVLTAVEAVVAEEGLAEATIERISEKLGMSKSSLYFYFRNKREMFGEMFARENELFLEEYNRTCAQLLSCEEQLYAYVVLLSAFFAHNPGVFKVMNWMWCQGLDTVELPDDYFVRVQRSFQFAARAIDSGRLRATRDDWLSLIGFFHVATVLICARHQQHGSAVREQMLSEARRLFELGMYGIDRTLADREETL